MLVYADEKRGNSRFLLESNYHVIALNSIFSYVFKRNSKQKWLNGTNSKFKRQSGGFLNLRDKVRMTKNTDIDG